MSDVVKVQLTREEAERVLAVIYARVKFINVIEECAFFDEGERLGPGHEKERSILRVIAMRLALDIEKVADLAARDPGAGRPALS